MVRVEFKTPELIRSLALQLGIRLDPPNDDDTNAGDAGGDGDAQQTGPEYYLLSVANFMVSGPLPPCVERRLAAGDVIKYYDTRTNVLSKEHPLKAEALALVDDMRARRPEGAERQTRMVCCTHDGTPYVHDFAAGGPVSDEAAREQHDDNVEDDQAEGRGGSEGNDGEPQQQGTAAAGTAEPPSPYSSQAARGRMIPDLSTAVLVAAGLLQRPEDVIAAGALRRLTFYSWWSEDRESEDLSGRIATSGCVGGGLQRCKATLVYDVSSRTFSVTYKGETGSAPPLRLPNADVRLATSAAAAAAAAGGKGAPPASTSSSASSRRQTQQRAQGEQDHQQTQEQQVKEQHNEAAAEEDQAASVAPEDLRIGQTVVVMGKPMTLWNADLETRLWLERRAQKLLKLRERIEAEVSKYMTKLPLRPVDTWVPKPSRPIAGHFGELPVDRLKKQLEGRVSLLEQYRPSRAQHYREAMEAALAI